MHAQLAASAARTATWLTAAERAIDKAIASKKWRLRAPAP
jgi:hypothetical protein